MEKSYRKKEVMLSRLRTGHIKTTYSCLLAAKQQPMCYACQTEYTVKHILIECTDLAHIRETFYSTNGTKELIQKTETNNAMPFQKAVNLYRNILRNFQQYQISPTNCISTRNISTKSYPFHKLFLCKEKKVFSTRRLPTNKLSTKPDSFYKSLLN